MEPEKKTIIKAIVATFETGHPNHDAKYNTVTNAPGDPGGLSFGAYQATRASGNLGFLVASYTKNKSAKYADLLLPFVDGLLACRASLDGDKTLQAALSKAGSDPVMHQCQEDFFDRNFWIPALEECRNRKIETPLGHLVVFDSFVHGSFTRIAQRVSPQITDETTWLREYCEARKAWLENHRNALLRKCVYRPKEILRLLDEKNFYLLPPIYICGISVAQRTPTEELSHVAARDDDDNEMRILRGGIPAMEGDDVVKVQRALTNKKIIVAVDGVYGPKTVHAVEAFQRIRGLVPDGIVGPATYRALGITSF